MVQSAVLIDSNIEPASEFASSVRQEWEDHGASKLYSYLNIVLIKASTKTDGEGPGIDDAAGFFANVFGGERFEEYVREIAITNQNYVLTADCRSARSR